MGRCLVPDEDSLWASVDSIASSLNARRAEILDAYERRLASRGSILILNEETRAQVLAQASDCLDEVISTLRSRRQEPEVLERGLSQVIGRMRAAQGMHPNESVQAASELFTATIDNALECLELDANEALVRVALTLHMIIMLKIREAASTYTGFLIGKIHEAQIDERKQLARNLHDRIGAMVGMSYRQLELFSMYRENDPDVAYRKVEVAMQSLAEVMNEVRQIASDLRIVEPQGGLRQALLAYTSAVTGTGDSVVVLVNGDERWLPDRTRDEVFLVVREALRNAIEHGKPQSVAARIDIAPHELRASVEDDGCGFRADRPITSGIGIRSMQERVAMLGGNFRLTSSPGSGTMVAIWIPLQRSAGIQ